MLVLDNSVTKTAQAAVVELTNQNQHMSYVGLWGNQGLGIAYNQGVAMARTQGADYVLLLDQDSIVAADMVMHLLHSFASAAERETPAEAQAIAAVGPRYVDRLTGRRSVLLGRRGISMGRLDDVDSARVAQPTAMLISSGSLIPLAVLDQLGGFDEGFFIDHIDTDFCLRASAQQLQLLVVSAAGMEHELGHAQQRIWFGRWHELPIHEPSRLYYIYRNSLRLMVRPHAHWRWRLFDLRRLCVILAVHLIAPGPRMARLANVVSGLTAGLLGRSGPR